jgi:pentatricopeptide repeat protein
MLTFTYVGLISGIILYGLPADASSVWKRMQVRGGRGC